MWLCELVRIHLKSWSSRFTRLMKAACPAILKDAAVPEYYTKSSVPKKYAVMDSISC